MKKHGQGIIPSKLGESLDKAGYTTEGYVDKKGTASGENAAFNCLPPGQNINDQYTADIRDLPMKRPTFTSNDAYANDGNAGSVGPESKQLDLGNGKTIDLPLAGRATGKE